MNKISHSKYKNTGILFELLVRQITVDTLKGNESHAINLIKKYFVKTELGKEYKLYETLLKSNILNETKANMVIDSLLEISKKLNRGKLKKEKYNLIKEIKEHYDLDFFLNSKIKNYKPLAAFYILLENSNSSKTLDSQQLINNKITLLEYLTQSSLKPNESDKDILEEFKEYNPDLRILAYKILLEKFNSKYSNLNSKQKRVLKEFINSLNNSSHLKEFYNSEIVNIKRELRKQIEKVDDFTTKIKLEEVQKLVKKLGKTCKIKTNNLIDLLQYYDLLENLQKSNEQI